MMRGTVLFVVVAVLCLTRGRAATISNEDRQAMTDLLGLLRNQASGCKTAGGCPTGWLSHGGSCYWFSHQLSSMRKAEAFCRENGAHLVQVESRQENEYLKHIARGFADVDFWLGMTDSVYEGEWKWSTSGDLVDITDWAPGEPKNPGPYPGKDCARLDHTHQFQWADADCNTQLTALCEKPSE